MITLDVNKLSDLAEILGIMLGDGNLYIGKKQEVYQIRIAGHKQDDEKYLMEWVKPLFENTFNVNVYKKLLIKDEMFICINSKRVAEILIKYGFPAGRKSVNKVTIPKWVFENEIFLKRCVRGLIDTDGFVYPIRLSYNYPRIGFVSGIESLRKSFSLAMNKLNFKISKWTIRKSGWTGENTIGQCSISSKGDVIRYYREIGFKNPKYIKKFNKFYKLPSSRPVK